MTKLSQTFVLGGERYRYFYGEYNFTWCNERTVEVPFIWNIVSEHPDGKVLEVGNVLSHYFPTRHLIVDKYERGINVTNEDIVEFWTEDKFDVIVSISTLEHVGWDERPRNPTKILKALQRLKLMLAEEGRVYVTLPWGVNPHLDRLIMEGKLGLTNTLFMRRVSFDNAWEECDSAQLRNAVYMHSYPDSREDCPPYPHANAILMGMATNESETF